MSPGPWATSRGYLRHWTKRTCVHISSLSCQQDCPSEKMSSLASRLRCDITHMLKKNRAFSQAVSYIYAYVQRSDTTLKGFKLQAKGNQVSRKNLATICHASPESEVALYAVCCVMCRGRSSSCCCFFCCWFCCCCCRSRFCRSLSRPSSKAD